MTSKQILSLMVEAHPADVVSWEGLCMLYAERLSEIAPHLDTPQLESLVAIGAAFCELRRQEIQSRAEAKEGAEAYGAGP